MVSGSVTALSLRSFRSRWYSGEFWMMMPAAERNRSTASGGRTKEVGCSFRYSCSVLSFKAVNETSIV